MTMTMKLAVGAALACMVGGALAAAPENGSKGKNKGIAVAEAPMQIQIDEATGRKVMPDDDASRVTVIPADDLAAIQRLESSAGDNVTVHENGMVSADVNEQHLKYLVMTIDGNGVKHVDHVSAKDLEVAAPVLQTREDR